MIRTVIVAGLALACLIQPALARHRHVSRLHPDCNVTMPCTPLPGQARSSGGFLEGVREIRVRMHRERRRSVRPMSEGLQKVIQTSAGRAAGVIRSASGATARVAARASAAFQCLVDRLERQGYPIRFMGGWRAHGSVRASLHPAGLALDINQLRRNVTRPRMPANEIQLANACGLISGRQWNWADSGHFQLGGWAGRGRHYARHRPGHRHRRHYASAP